MSRKAHTPTDQTRESVKYMKIVGGKDADIAKALGITRPTLNKHYKQELKQGKQQLGGQLAKTAYQIAFGYKYKDGKGLIKEKQPNPAMVMFLLKTQFGFSETQKHEFTNEIPSIKVKILDEEGNLPD